MRNSEQGFRMLEQRFADVLKVLLLIVCISGVAPVKAGVARKLLGNTQACNSFTWDNYTVLMVADPGTFSGTPEALHFEESLKNLVHLPSGSMLCPRITMGELMGQPTIVATSGIGPTTAALCVFDLMKCAGTKIKDLIYVGTSGWSSALGGILNADDCSEANPTHRITRLGDVCVTPMSINWSCKQADWVGQAQGYPDMCFLPGEIDGPSVASLYGDCVFDTHTDGSIDLAREILRASAGENSLSHAPLRNSVIQGLESQYWAYMSNTTRVKYDLNPKHPPRVWNYRQCVEVDSQFFFSGVPWEMTARNYSALTINTAFNTSKTAHNVIAVSAMEGVGVAQALDNYNALNDTKVQIPYVFVRGFSDWIHQPVRKLSDGTWTYTAPTPTNFAEGYKYAVATTSNVVLSMLSHRCKNLYSANSALCDYAVTYG